MMQRVGVGAPRNRLLRALSNGAYQQLAPHLEESDPPRGTVLVEPGQPLSRLYFPHGGLVSARAIYRGGDAVEMAAIGREGCIGLPGLLGARISAARLLVMMPGGMTSVNLTLLRDLMAAKAEIRALLDAYTAGFLHQVMVCGACNGAHCLSERLARWLLTMQDRERTSEIGVTQELLAEMLCVHRPTLTMALHLFQGAGLVKLRRGAVTVMDRAGLEEATCECYWLIRREHEALAPY